jgi:hypothetical protein
MRVPGERALRSLAAYDDAALPARRRRRLDALLARSPVARRELERQRAVRSALAGFAVEAPPSLRLEAERVGARQTRTRPLLIPAVGAACLAAVLVGALTLGGSGPAVDAVAELAHARPAEPAPARAPDRPQALERRFAGVEFPSWSAEFGWRATGARTDVVDGRDTSTVFYEHQGHRLAYTVVAGAPLDPPAGARRVRVGGVDVRVYADGDHTVAVFERGGHTCVLAGHVMRRSTALELAGWHASGSLRF